MVDGGGGGGQNIVGMNVTGNKGREIRRNKTVDGLEDQNEKFERQ